MNHAISDFPMIYYAVIAFNTKIIVEVDEFKEHNKPSPDEHRVGKPRKPREKKYIRASKKILKKIENDEIRRPDGMSTLISGTYSYNYILGYEYCNNSNYPLLESLVFLAVLPLYGQHQNNVTELDRNVAFNFLASIRRDFLTSFAANLQYFYDHQSLDNIAVRLEPPNVDYIPDISAKDENLCTNLFGLSEIMIQRMYGNYKNPFQYKPLQIEDTDDNINLNINDPNNHTLDGTEDGNDNNHTLDAHDDEQHTMDKTEDLRVPREESGEFVNIRTPSKSMSDSFVGISMPNSRDSSSNNVQNGNVGNVGNAGYGSMHIDAVIDDIDDGNHSQSRINDFMESIFKTQQQMKDRIKASMSVSSLRSLATPSVVSDDKFVEYETMPLIGSTTSLLHGEYSRDYDDSQGFITRHRKKVAFAVAILVVIYVIIAMFCGWSVQSCGLH